MYNFAKRTLDVAVSGASIIILGPLLLTLATLVKLTSKGPAFFTQERVGLNGGLFTIYKLRSMYVDAPKYALHPTDERDPRITPIGRILRKTSFDELPQLLNIFIGDMSLVGPRPEMPNIVKEYNCLQRKRLEVKPGLTGLWQISKHRKDPIHQNMKYDLYYIKNKSLWLDTKILCVTPVAIILNKSCAK